MNKHTKIKAQMDMLSSTALLNRNVLQRSAVNRASIHQVSSIVDGVLRSPGQPLDPATRAFMEPRFGHDFSQVRVHTDADAAESALSVNAQAYTVGRDIVFGSGQLDPQTINGQKLLVHELTHVAQPKDTNSHGISQPNDAGEREATHAANSFAEGKNVTIGSAQDAIIQRQPLPESKGVDFGDMLLENASPLLAAALGSTTLDQFDTGKADLKPDHITQLASVAHSIRVLLRKYSLSTVTVVGHADTVGQEVMNFQLGQQRADVVKQALSDLGIPEIIILAESKGEGAPQAKETKDEVPSAQNRRVEIQFHPKESKLGLMTPELTLPSADKRPSPDLGYHPKVEPPDPTKLPPDFWKPIPPVANRQQSPLDMIGERILDPVIDSVAGWLPKKLRDKIKDGARSTVKSGVAKGARAAAEAAGITDPKGLEAIEKAAEAAIQAKGKPSP